MGYSYHKTKGPERPSLIISNHNTDLDPALVGMCFSRHVYYLASEHAFRNGFPSKVLKAVFAPIPIDKTRADISAIKEMIRRIKAGANVCLFAEGDRSFTGTTSPIALSTAKLVRTCGVDLITFRLEGGYFTQPRWSRSQRRGKMAGFVIGRYSAAEIASMSDRQILNAIEKDIYEDAYERQKVNFIRFKGKNLAESIETTLFLCPGCGKFGTIRSEGDRFSCACGVNGTYTETGFLAGDSPFSTIAEWGEWQSGKLEEIVRDAGGESICEDDEQQLFEVKPTIEKTLLGTGKLRIDREALHCAGFTFPLKQITQVEVVGQMTLLFAVKGNTTYEVRSATPRSALKYREIFHNLRSF